MTIPQTVLLVIDGFGSNPQRPGNAVLNATTPNLDQLWNNYPHTLLKAAEEEVGLAFGEMGNSEVGHLCIGTGRVLFQSLPRINESIANGSFFSNAAFLKAIEHAKINNSALHVMGMVSVAGVHAHLNHFLAIIELAARHKLPRVYLHIILDGRDSGPQDAPIYLEKINQAISKHKTGIVATISGRAYTMDRNRNWERTQLAYKAILGVSGAMSSTPLQAATDNYAKGLDDENLPPTIIVDANNQPQGPLRDNDAFIFTNYREDRARQIMQMLTDTPPAQSDPKPPQGLLFATMTKYDNRLPTDSAFAPQLPPNTLSDCLHQNGINQIHISETEKYAHMTYFFNGGRETPHPTEKFIHIPSPKPETFVEHPEMAAGQILTAALSAIDQGWPFIVLNFANPDMIAHTGNLQATVKAVSLIDDYIGQIYRRLQTNNGYLFITSDHGNSESMLDPATQQATKDHTSNPVPFIAAVPSLAAASIIPERITQGAPVSGILADITPTILRLLKIDIPIEMTGNPLF